MEISLEITYEILIQWAKKGAPGTYTDLSMEYSAKASCGRIGPHGSWDKPLGELANIVASASMPPLTAMVVLKDKNEPGRDFWGCAPGIPSYIKDDEKRIEVWMKMVNDCHSFDWPPFLHDIVSF